MNLLTEKQREQLLLNGSDDNRDKDHYPIAKIQGLGDQTIYLLVDIDPDDPDFCFALCDLGTGFPEFKFVSLPGLQLKRDLGIRFEQDLSFQAKYPISVYAKAARECGFITEDDALLSTIAMKQEGQVITSTATIFEVDIKPIKQSFTP